MLFRITGRDPKFFSVPVALMDFIIGLLELVGKVIPPVGVRDVANHKSPVHLAPDASSSIIMKTDAQLVSVVRCMVFEIYRCVNPLERRPAPGCRGLLDKFAD